MTFKFNCGQRVGHVCDKDNPYKFRDLLVLARAEHISGVVEYCCRNGVSAPQWFAEEELLPRDSETEAPDA